tara:strand:+ start:1542 stop:2216 length:675 start_codon:yes stop_codon:yes gene_type:complete
MRLNKTFKIAAVFFILVLFTIIFWQQLFNFFSNPDKIRNTILATGVLAPIIFIFLIILQVLIAPVPGQAMGLMSGYVFGPVRGTLYSMIGLTIGSYIAFKLSRIYGIPLVKKIVDKRTFEKFNKIALEKGPFTLFLLYLFPALPDDSICYIAGLTKIKIKNLVIISAIGRFPGFLVLNVIGSGLYFTTFSSLILLGLLTIISFLIYLSRNKIEKAILRFIKKIS